jgi:hypothetical protein
MVQWLQFMGLQHLTASSAAGGIGAGGASAAAASHILLDENLTPMLSDFGLAHGLLRLLGAGVRPERAGHRKV